MLQAAVLDGVAFDHFSFHQDGLPASEVDIGRREVFQALVIALVVVESTNLPMQASRSPGR